MRVLGGDGAGVVVAAFAGITAAAGPLRAQTPDVLRQTVPGTDVSFQMVLIPAGSFVIGSPWDEAGRDDDEGPQRRVAISSLWMMTTEVTHDLFSVFRDRRLDTEVGWAPDVVFDVDAVTRPSPPYEDPSNGMSGPGLPATGMTRLSALRFARWLSEKTGRLYRLPTEAEWEYVCRAGGEGPWGRGSAAPGPADVASATTYLEDHAWYEANSGGAFRAVGGKSPNAWGVHDMLGNVAEWMLDPYDADFYASLPEDGSAVDPTNAPTSRGRGVVRGGAFDDDPTGLRCADRFEETPAWKRRDPQIPKSSWWNTDSPHVGFRLVSPAVEYSQEQIRAYWDAMLGTG